MRILRFAVLGAIVSWLWSQRQSNEGPRIARTRPDPRPEQLHVWESEGGALPVVGAQADASRAVH